MDQPRPSRQYIRTTTNQSRARWAPGSVWLEFDSHSKRRTLGRILAAGLLVVALGGCRFEALKEAMNGELIRQGHAATVDCLQAERAITGGDELRCEEWDYVRQNYLKPE